MLSVVTINYLITFLNVIREQYLGVIARTTLFLICECNHRNNFFKEFLKILQNLQF